MTTLTALVVARDEAGRLGDCLATLGFADALLVVLDRTTDGSAAIAAGVGARVLAGAWAVEGDRRNAGIAACATEWVLEVDADERVPPALGAEIRAVIAASPHAFHRVPIDNHIGDRLVRHGWAGGFGTGAKPILFRRTAKRWARQRVHPTLHWTGTEGPRLRAAVTHLVDQDISDMLRRLDRYAAARATDLLETGDIGTLGGNLRRAVSRAGKAYLGRGGWREGGWGVLLALCAGLYPLLAHLKARLEPERHRPGATDPVP